MFEVQLSAENHQLISQPFHLIALAWKKRCVCGGGGGSNDNLTCLVSINCWEILEDTDSHAFIINTMSDEPEILSSCSMEIILRLFF